MQQFCHFCSTEMSHEEVSSKQTEPNQLAGPPVFPWWYTLFNSESPSVCWKARVMPKLCTVFARIDLVDVTRRDDAGCGYFRNRRNQKLSAGATSVKRSSMPELIIGAFTETAFEITPSSCDFVFHLFFFLFFLHQLYTIHNVKKFQEHIHEITSLCGFKYAHRQFKWWAEPLWHHPLVCEMLFQNRERSKISWSQCQPTPADGSGDMLYPACSCCTSANHFAALHPLSCSYSCCFRLSQKRSRCWDGQVPEQTHKAKYKLLQPIFFWL